MTVETYVGVVLICLPTKAILIDGSRYLPGTFDRQNCSSILLGLSYAGQDNLYIAIELLDFSKMQNSIFIARESVVWDLKIYTHYVKWIDFFPCCVYKKVWQKKRFLCENEYNYDSSQ